MFGTKSGLSPLQSRKSLLVAESDLNRAQLAEDWKVMSHGVHTVASRVRSFGSIASVAATIGIGLSAFQCSRVATKGVKTSWLQTAVTGAKIVSSLWLTFASRKKENAR
jgi:hypothetical protein